MSSTVYQSQWVKQVILARHDIRHVDLVQTWHNSSHPCCHSYQHKHTASAMSIILLSAAHPAHFDVSIYVISTHTAWVPGSAASHAPTKKLNNLQGSYIKQEDGQNMQAAFRESIYTEIGSNMFLFCIHYIVCKHAESDICDISLSCGLSNHTALGWDKIRTHRPVFILNTDEQPLYTCGCWHKRT